jgi:hypothetical protein
MSTNRVNSGRSRRAAFEWGATVSSHRAKNLIDPPLAATRNADRKYPAVSGLYDRRRNGLCKLLRKHLTSGVWTTHCGLPAAHGHFHRRRLSAGEKLGLGHASGCRYCSEKHQKFGFQNRPPIKDNHSTLILLRRILGSYHEGQDSGAIRTFIIFNQKESTSFGVAD